MEDPVEIRRRIEALAKRVNRRDDYGALLASGELVLDITEVDPPKWRARIRAQARADRIKIRTGQTDRIVWAMVQQPFDEDARMTEAAKYMRAIDQVFEVAKVHGHDPLLIARDQTEGLVGCRNCEALGYLDIASSGIRGGDLLDSHCLTPDMDQ
jgi:hypothetical protein